MKRIAALAPLLTSSAFAQCVMCFRTAAAQNAARARVMNLGIIIMLIPPVLILTGFLLLCYKRRKTYAESEPAELAPVQSELADEFELTSASSR
jgi:hypothetical protein